METLERIGGRAGGFLPRMLLRRSEAAREAGRPDDAVADARRAVAVLGESATPGMSLSSLGYAHLALARALFDAAQESEARESLRSAVEQLTGALESDHPDARAASALAGR